MLLSELAYAAVMHRHNNPPKMLLMANVMSIQFGLQNYTKTQLFHAYVTVNNQITTIAAFISADCTHPFFGISYRV
jgi:hypothetical protein